MPRSFTFSTITEYKAAKASSGTVGAIYAELVSSGTKSGSCVSKITATGDVFIDSINPFVTPELGQEGDTLYYSSTEGYRFLRAGNTTWDADSYGQVYIDLAKIPAGFSVVAPYTDIFNFKQTDENIGSGKASMTKILGNTVAWNQLVDMTTWTATKASITGLSAGNATITSTASGDAGLTKSNVCVSGHKIYARAAYKASASGVIFAMYLGSWSVSGRGFFSETAADTNWHSVSTILIAASGTHGVYVANSVSGQSIQISGLEYIDLTLLYGPAIDGMTDAQILAKFESEFPGYHSYNAGQLLSNKAKAIEFVGFNQWDEEWEVGSIDNDTGQNTPNNDVWRSKNYSPILAGETYYCYCRRNVSGAIIYFYDANKNYINRLTAGSASNRTFTAPNNAAYIRVRNGSGYGFFTYNHDVCINLSGKRNGQYEPYKKVVLPLPNLDQIKVYSHNIWDEEWVANTAINTSTGIPYSSDNIFASKNFIPVSASTKYYYQNGAWSNRRIIYYDASYNYISCLDTSGLGEFTTPANCAYIKFYSAGTAYQNNICINLSSSFNGQYEPHGILTMEGGLKSAGSVRDEIVGNKYIKRVGVTTIGALNMLSKNSTTFYSWALRNVILQQGNNIKCSIYATGTQAAVYDSYTVTGICIGEEGFIGIHDDNLSGSTSPVANAVIYYALATPIEYEIYSPTKMPFNWKYRASEYHTKKMLPENGENPTSAPFACEIKQI